MAVREFADARPQGIYKQQYLDDLKARYGDEDDEDLMVGFKKYLKMIIILKSPGRPLWENGPLSDEEYKNDGAFSLELEMNGKMANEQNNTEVPFTSFSASSSNSAPASSSSGDFWHIYKFEFNF
jgi:hypothetical protein